MDFNVGEVYIYHDEFVLKIIPKELVSDSYIQHMTYQYKVVAKITEYGEEVGRYSGFDAGSGFSKNLTKVESKVLEAFYGII